MSNVAENELKNLKNDLKNSLENLLSDKAILEVRIEDCGITESLYPHVLWKQKTAIEKEILDRRFQIAVLELLDRMSEPISVMVGEPSEIDWEKVRNGLVDVFQPHFDVREAREVDEEVRRRFFKNVDI